MPSINGASGRGSDWGSVNDFNKAKTSAKVDGKTYVDETKDISKVVNLKIAGQLQRTFAKFSDKISDGLSSFVGRLSKSPSKPEVSERTATTFSSVYKGVPSKTENGAMFQRGIKEPTGEEISAAKQRLESVSSGDNKVWSQTEAEEPKEPSQSETVTYTESEKQAAKQARAKAEESSHTGLRKNVIPESERARAQSK